MPNLAKNMFRSAAVLGVFAILGTALVAFTHNATQQTILENKRQYTLKKLQELIPPDLHDNDLDRDQIQITDPLLDKKRAVPVYRARKDGRTIAIIMQAVAPDGYSGRITLLVAVSRNGDISGVRVTEHKETPGLGDAIETSKSDWIRRFKGKSLDKNPGDWLVTRDGGDIDQITSATITSRAVVKAVQNALVYFNQHRKFLLDEP